MTELQERIAKAVFKVDWSDDPEYTWETSCADDRTNAEEFAQAIIDELGLVEEKMTTGASMLEQLFNMPITVTRRYVTAWEAM